MEKKKYLTLPVGRGKFFSVENLKEFVGGLLPLRLLSTEILTYIDDRIAALAPGGGSVADAVNYSGSVTTSGTANAVSATVASWKLRGFHVQGTGNATVTLNYTVSSSAKTIKCQIDDMNPQFSLYLPNPLPVDDGSVTLSVTNTSGASADYTGVIFGE
jgi:hypothetical protein